MTTSTPIQDQYDPAFQVCYGCGAQNPHGLQIKSRCEGGEVVAEFMPGPEHLGVPGVVYGGLLASLIDCHGIATGAEHFQRLEQLDHPPRCVTASLHVEYRKPTPMNGQPLQLRARVVEASARKAVVEVSLGVGGETTVEARVIAVKLPPALQA
jgi:acyl-coenzyme A thioesterase PaaI-like protein